MNIYHLDDIPDHLKKYFKPVPQMGLESTPDEYVREMVAVFAEVRRVLRDDGTLWLNIGDSYARNGGTPGGGNRELMYLEGTQSRMTKIPRGCNLKEKDLVGIPWMLAFALRADGWYLRQDIIWAKPNPMPESVQGSHYSRHRVTIEEYERLSGLRYIDERAGDDWAGNMPLLSEREIPQSKAPLSAKQERKIYGTSEGREAGSQREAPPVRSVTQGQGEQREVSPDTKRASGGPEAICGSAREGNGSGGVVDCSGVAGDIGASQIPLLLLQEEEDEIDDGPCDSTEQEGEELSGEHCSGVSVVQLRKEGQTDPPLLVGCPGCPKCLQYHGYTFHMSAGRCTKSHEYLFLLSKSARYYYDQGAILEDVSPGTHDRLSQDVQSQIGSERVPGKTNGNMKAVGRSSWHGSEFHTGKTGEHQLGRAQKDRKLAEAGSGTKNNESFDAAMAIMPEKRNKRSVWTINTQGYSEAHFATFPEALIQPCILAGCPPDGTVLDPFGGSMTTLKVARDLNCKGIAIELNPEYIEIGKRRLVQEVFDFTATPTAEDAQ